MEDRELKVNDLLFSGGHFASLANGHQKLIAETEKKIKELEKEVKQLKAYIKEMEELDNETRSKILQCILDAGLKAVSAFGFKFQARKNPPKVVIEDESQIPDKYKREKVVVTVDKDKIKREAKHGVYVQGTKVIQESRLVIVEDTTAIGSDFIYHEEEEEDIEL